MVGAIKPLLGRIIYGKIPILNIREQNLYYDDDFMSGYLAICDRLKEDDLFVAIVYHEWFIIENKEALAGE